MADPQVLASQQWVNATFGQVAGYIPCPENGMTGTSTVLSLTMGLQSLLGISPVVPSFGPTTWADLLAYGNVGPSSSTNMIRLVQAAFYCKGYDGSGLSGSWDTRTIGGMNDLQADLGYSSSQFTTTLPPKLFRFALNTDPATLISGGNPTVRAAQQWINLQYIGRQNFFYSSTSGIFDRTSQLNLVYGIQYELGLSDAIANGNFGPTTQADLMASAASRVSVGSSDGSSHWVHLFKAALAYNQFYPSSYDGTFTTSDQQCTIAFQEFSAFAIQDVSGTGSYPTWAELLVSTGDPTRVGRALDCASTVTSPRASSIVSAGYQVVGRYLTNEQSANPLDKNIKPGEIQTILDAGLAIFPIFEEGGYEASWFTQAQGELDAARASTAALGYGFPGGTTIYFAVDFDATDADIDPTSGDNTNTTGILAYFRGVQIGMSNADLAYPVGVYGARHVCTRVCNKGLATSSYVGGLSTGWSGNLGFPLPSNWAFNQIETLTIGTGTGAIEIDKDVMSGRNKGVDTMNSLVDPNEAAFDYFDWLQARASDFNAATPNSGSTDDQLVAQYMRLPDFTGLKWAAFAGPINQDFVDYVDGFNVPAQTAIVDPLFQVSIGTEHLFGAISARIWELGIVPIANTDPAIFPFDYVNWAGDLIQLFRAYINYGDRYASATAFAEQYINSPDPTLIESDFGQEDLIQDVCGYVIASSSGIASLSTQVRGMFSITGDFITRYTDFVDQRFGDKTTLQDAAQEVCTSTNILLVEIREQFEADVEAISVADRNAIALVFADKLWDLAS